jgi:Flp pilus assembly protein TadG
VAAETAVVLGVLLVLMCGLIVGGIGVFRYQQVACTSREGARWASVRGYDYQTDTGLSSPTAAQVTADAVLPLAVSMDPAAVTVQVQWIDEGSGTVWDWDAAPKYVRSISPSGEYVANTVRVTVTYVWSPGIFWNPITLQSVSQMPMSH